MALWDRSSLAADSFVDDTGGWGGITLAHCVASREEVDAITEAARMAGAIVAREPAVTFWGGYDSIAIDPDGHPWEVDEIVRLVLHAIAEPEHTKGV